MSVSREEIVRVEGLVKEFRTGMGIRRKRALDGISFRVLEGEIFGFVGPNGAGKTTTLKILMGLIFATSGRASVLGHDVGETEFRRRVGFLPENPYFYEFLTGREILRFYAKLSGVAKPEIERRVETLLDWVGLAHAADARLRTYSKGMLQRVGIAQALVHDPSVVFLDEPMSGLDPIGRKEVRDLIIELREQGKTVFFSSHILSDVEQISDRVAIVVGGKIQDVGRPRELVGHAPLGTEVLLHLTAAGDVTAGAAAPADALAAATAAITARADKVRAERDELLAVLGPGADVDDFLAFARGHGGKVVSVTPRYETLEDLFLRRVEAARAPAAREAAS